MNYRGRIICHFCAPFCHSILSQIPPKAVPYYTCDSFSLRPYGDILFIHITVFFDKNSSLQPLYAPMLENSVVILMTYDEIKSFSFIPEFSIQEL